MRKDEFIGQKFHWFTGEIVDIDDDQNFNRVRVYCHGYHDKKFKEENKESLPWAIVMMPTTSAGTPNVGANHHLEVGSWVIGFFRDGESAQDPIVMGSITSSTATTMAMSEAADNQIQLYDLPYTASTTNKVYKSKAGHLIEIENKERVDAVAAVEAVEAVAASEGVEAVEAVAAVKEVLQEGPVLRVTHAGGTVIEIDEDNNLTITVKEGGDLGITVEKGDTSIITGGDTTITSTGDTTITSWEKLDLISGKELTITSAEKTIII